MEQMLEALTEHYRCQRQKLIFFGNVINGVVKAAAKVGAAYLTGGLSYILGSDTATASGFSGAVTDAAAGTVSGFLNGIFGFTKHSTSSEKISLSINTNIALSGSSTEGSQLFDNKFAIPGTSGNTQAIPFYPAYNKPMGVFYISNTPNIIITKSSQKDLSNPIEYDAAAILDIDNSSFNIIFNPVIDSIATISNIKKDIVVMGPTPHNVVSNYDQLENIGGRSACSGTSIGYSVQGEPRPIIAIPSADSIFLRISFDVVPNNGASKQTIVKTFNTTSTIVNQ